MSEQRSIRIGHLYPEAMNLYGDRGNVITLARRAAWRLIGVEVVPLHLGNPFPLDTIDLLFAGGDQDREQHRVAADLTGAKADALRAALSGGLPALVVCGSFQLFGHYYQAADGSRLAGIDVFDLHTIHPGASVARCVGNVAIRWQDTILAGFENHGGRTYLGPGCQPLGRVIAGCGNNGEDGTEGAVVGNAYGTYLHGALLPKNPEFADHLLALALARRYGDAALPPLDDRIERKAREVAIDRAKRERRQLANTGARSR